jgi:hypothetical protein
VPGGEWDAVKLALVITLAFVAATSALGGVHNLANTRTHGYLSEYLGATVAFGMTVWCFYLAYWVFRH